jgi:hypothetical protein
MNVSLRPLEGRDLDTIYQQVTDPESIRMAAFTAEDQTDRRAFLKPNFAPADRHECLAPSHRCRRSNRWNDRVVPNRQSTRGDLSDNVASLRVLEKAGFRRVGVNRGLALARGEEIEETILRLD